MPNVRLTLDEESMKKLGGLADLENKSPEDALRDLVLAVLDGKLAKAEAAKSKKGVK